jgi:hypothetical protein
MWNMDEDLHGNHSASIMTKFSQYNDTNGEMLSCTIVVIVTCYLNDVLCGIVIKMCYFFASCGIMYIIF